MNHHQPSFFDQGTIKTAVNFMDIFSISMAVVTGTIVGLALGMLLCSLLYLT